MITDTMSEPTASEAAAHATAQGEEAQTLHQTLENAKEPRAHPEKTSEASTGSTPEKPAAIPASETHRPAEANTRAPGATRSGE